MYIILVYVFGVDVYKKAVAWVSWELHKNSCGLTSLYLVINFKIDYIPEIFVINYFIISF